MSAASQEETLLDTIRGNLAPIHPDGWKFVAIFSVAALVLFAIFEPLGWLGCLATAWCAYFFRDPERVTPAGSNFIVSPADGKISNIVEVEPPKELNIGDAPRIRVSIFLNVFDVHINRIPVNGTISALKYIKGKFVNASLDKASEDNERQLVGMRLENGKDIGFVQIAGLVARRIVCYLGDGQEVRAGERFGLIRFGSRVDVYLPEGVQPLVIVGQRAVGGETILADTDNANATRTASQ